MVVVAYGGGRGDGLVVWTFNVERNNKGGGVVSRCDCGSGGGA